MSEGKSPPVTSFLPIALLLFVTGWGGLAVLVLRTLPTVGPRWLFFFLLVLSLTGTFLPVTAFINRRFPSQPAATPAVVVRQATWVGVYGATMAWLRIGRVLTPVMALLLFIGLVLIEFLLRLNERSQWKPSQDQPQD